jgi:hypothetical protein
MITIIKPQIVEVLSFVHGELDEIYVLGVVVSFDPRLHSAITFI